MEDSPILSVCHEFPFLLFEPELWASPGAALAAHSAHIHMDREIPE